MRTWAAGAALATVLLSTATPAAAQAKDAFPTVISVSARSGSVEGKPIGIRATLDDARGRSVPGALIQLVTAVTFMGEKREQILDESRTDEDGIATLLFAPVDAGEATVTVRFAGAGVYGPAQAKLRFQVVEPVVAFDPEPPGLQVPWARSYFILVPLIGVWLAYLVALGQAGRIRRLGIPREGADGDRFPIRGGGGGA